jgi:hypothetical protein
MKSEIREGGFVHPLSQIGAKSRQIQHINLGQGKNVINPKKKKIAGKLP